MRAYLTNLGCKLNQAELDTLARRVSADGHEIVDSLDQADLHVVNTCTVTRAAARKSRKMARQGSRSSHAVRTVLTGCYVEGSPRRAARLAGVDLVVPNHDKEHLLERLYESFPEWRPRSGDEVPVPYVPLRFGNSRALVKIEDGCNMACSFCIIPRTRGRQVSRPVDEIVAEVRLLADGGYSEIVLTGVQISSYRQDDVRLVGLLRKLLDRTSVARLRLTSIAPWDFDAALLDLIGHERICSHFHLSLQSGSNRILRAMRRPYDRDGFAGLVERIRRVTPHAAITTDVIVGFPGESEADFADTVDLVTDLELAKVHAFPFSPRAATRAAELPVTLPAAGLKRRMRTMLAAAERVEGDFLRRQLGRRLDVLWERKRHGRWHGTSDNYVKVVTESEELLERRIVPTRIVGAVGAEAIGRLGTIPSADRPSRRIAGAVGHG